MKILRILKYNQLVATNNLILNNDLCKHLILNKRFFNYDNWYKGKKLFKLIC